MSIVLQTALPSYPRTEDQFLGQTRKERRQKIEEPVKVQIRNNEILWAFFFTVFSDGLEFRRTTRFLRKQHRRRGCLHAMPDPTRIFCHLQSMNENQYNLKKSYLKESYDFWAYRYLEKQMIVWGLNRQ